MEQSKFYQIKNVTEHEYTLVGCNGSAITRPIQDVDKSASAFTIQDAKDGDVLANWNNTIYLFKGIEEEVVKFYCYYNTNCEKFSIPLDNNSHLGLTESQFEHHPATKKQRNLLFQKMKEAGYEWDAEKKELKKIVTPKFKIEDTMRTLQEASNGITSGLPVIVSIDEEYYHCTNELIAIKEQDDYEYPPMNRRQNLANSAKTCKVEQNPAWSEEDETVLDNLIYSLANDRIGNNRDEYVDWLKSLKDRVQPQNTWKPSDEQMMYLSEAIDVVTRAEKFSIATSLKELRERLKELMEE